MTRSALTAGLAWFPVLGQRNEISVGSQSYLRHVSIRRQAARLPGTRTGYLSRIYEQFAHHPDSVQWVSEPARAEEVWPNFEASFNALLRQPQFLLKLLQRHSFGFRIDGRDRIKSTSIMVAKKKNGVAVDFCASTGKTAEIKAFMIHKVDVPTACPWREPASGKLRSCRPRSPRLERWRRNP